MVHTFDLSGKVILITGGYGYLGSAVVKSLQHHGASLYVLGRDKAKFDQSFSGLSAEGMQNVHFETCDISRTESIATAYRRINKQEGHIDVLINNAFYSKGQDPERMTDEEWAYGIDGSLNSVFRGIREIIPYLKKTGKGKVINVSSMYGMVAPQFEVYDDFPQFLNPPHYGAAKAGIVQLTKYYASYLGALNINVNTVTPGPFPSDTIKQNEKFVKALEAKTCLGRVGLPEDLAGAFVFLASNASDFITGQNIIVDGGWTAT